MYVNFMKNNNIYPIDKQLYIMYNYYRIPSIVIKIKRSIELIFKEVKKSKILSRISMMFFVLIISAVVGGASVFAAEYAADTAEKFGAALEKASSGDSIHIDADIVFGDNSYTISGKSVTVDLNGHKLSVSAGGNNDCFMTLADAAVLTIDDTSLAQNGSIWVDQLPDSEFLIFDVLEKSCLVLNNGALISGTDTEAGGTVIYLQNAGSEFIMNGGTIRLYSGPSPDGFVQAVRMNADSVMTMNGGKITSGAAISVGYLGRLTINGGIVEAQTESLCDNKYSLLLGDDVENFLIITGGEFKGNLHIEPSTNVEITGGTFDTDVSAYLAEGYEQDMVTGLVLAAGSGDAAIGDVVYKTLDLAIAAAKDGDTITLLKPNVKKSTPIIIDGGKEITIDLGGNLLEFQDGEGFEINNGTLHIVGPGNISDKFKSAELFVLYGSAEDVPDYSVLTIEGGVVMESATCVKVKQDSGAGYGINVEISGGTMTTGSNATLSDAPLYVDEGEKLTGENVPKITLDGVTIEQTSAKCGVFLGSNSQTVIKNSTVICDGNGGTGIGIRAGDLTVIDSNITAGAGTPNVITDGNDAVDVQNVGLAVAQNDSKQAINVTVEGNTTITGGAAFYESNPAGNSQEDLELISVNINDGTWTGDVYSEDMTEFISGGNFSEHFSEDYCADGYEEVANGSGTYDVLPVANKISVYATDAITRDGFGILRFITKVDVAAGVPQSYGSYIIPMRLFEGTDLDAAPRAVVTYYGNQTPIESGQTFSADLMKIPAGYMDDPIYARSFMVCADGSTITCEFEPISANGAGATR